MKPWAHQEEEFRLHRSDEARALLWQMRTGKSRAVVDLACHLFLSWEIGGVLIVAPNGVHRQWLELEVPKHCWPGVMCVKYAWRFANPNNFREWTMFQVMCAGDAMRWMAVNLESMIRPEVQRAVTQFKKRCGRALIVFDESHHFARPGAKRTGVARGLARQFEYRRILTGTESENSPLQSFSQYELLEREALGHKTYGSFKSRYADYELVKTRSGQRFPKLTGYKNLDELKRAKAKYSSVVLRSDCNDLPPVQRDLRVIELTKKQAELWHSVKANEIETLERLGRDAALVGGAALVKLQQIEGGIWKHADGRVEHVVSPDNNPKMLVSIDEIMQYDGQVLVWFQYIHELEAICDKLTEMGVTCGRFHGTAKHRDRDLLAFQQGRLRVMLGQPTAGGEGRSFPAGKIVWHSATPDAVVRSQANERATVMGGESVQIVDLAAPGGVDDRFIRLTDTKTLRADDMSRDGLRALKELDI